MASLHFRPMRAIDLDAVSAIETDIYTHPWTRGNFSDSLAAGHSCWVVEDDGELAAYGVLMVGVGETHLLNISVARQARRRGLGTRLLAFFETRSREFGARAMLLEVRRSNGPARALYERAGFHELAIRRGYYPATEGREDAILMGKDL
ncbi:MAG: ribosomal-protein-alanine N-acetyltransferase [Betaproteobacteria bacterium]|nr:ribosomal-protein-alanine N-acetyltransferase [Betaproteobacteria bacterium]